MKSAVRLFLSLLVAAVILFEAEPEAKASIPTNTDIGLIIAGIAAGGAAIGLGVYFAVRQTPSITGCADADASGGFTLRNENDQQTYSLIGDVGAVKAGDRVRAMGKRKKDAAGGHTFLVDKVKDFGPCKAH